MAEFHALSRKPLSITVAGEQFHLPWRPAAEWALSLERYAVLSAVLAEPKDRDRLALLLLERPDACKEIEQESYRLLAEQAGRPWWEAVRLVMAADSPEALGHLTLAGVDPWSVSFGQWCAATYALYTKDQNAEGRLKFDFSLSIPPEGFEDEWDDGADDADAIALAVAGMMR